MRRFREGGFNTLVSTCVGEEGLDIGEVDLIVCFDAQKSPIRLVQRMGRTGRRRQGRIVVILAEGREERVSEPARKKKALLSTFICVQCDVAVARVLEFDFLKFESWKTLEDRHIYEETYNMYGIN